MAYSTLADLEKYLDPRQIVDLSDDDKDGIADPAVIDEVIDGADADIDVYLSNNYTVPLSPVPEVVKKLSAKMAIYYLWLRRKEASVPEKWATEYDNMLELLKSIAAGDIKLGDDVAEESAISQGAQIGRAASDATFTFEKLRNF